MGSAGIVIGKPLESVEHLPGDDLLAGARNQPVVEEDRRIVDSEAGRR